MSQRIALALTLVNLALLAFQAVGAAQARDPGILRGTGLEIVDSSGAMRAQLVVAPANPTYAWPDGSHTGIPETVIFRLITADGKPRVKLTTSTEGSGLMLLGDSDTTHAILEGSGHETSLLLRNDEKVQQTLRP